MAVHPGATVAGTILGTAAYMSPEQARGRSVDRRSDVWPFGCVLFECFAGRAPFEGATVTDLLAKILEREPDRALLPAGTPPRARETLRRCLRKEADDRPREIRDVRLELADVASGAAKGETAREKSVAVLPFENLSAARAFGDRGRASRRRTGAGSRRGSPCRTGPRSSAAQGSRA